MIHTEKIIVGGTTFVRTWSDTNLIERGGIRYAEAVDPEELGRGYTETNEPLPELSAQEALDIILGGDGV